MLYTTIFPLLFVFLCIAFWQSHKMELRLVKRNVVITVYSSETSFRVMVHIYFIHLFSFSFFAPSAGCHAEVTLHSLCLHCFFDPSKCILPDQISHAIRVFSSSLCELQECFAKQYIYSHMRVWAHSRSRACMYARLIRQSVKKIYLISSNFFSPSVPLCWSGVVEFFGTFFIMAF